MFGNPGDVWRGGGGCYSRKLAALNVSFLSGITCFGTSVVCFLAVFVLLAREFFSVAIANVWRARLQKNESVVLTICASTFNGLFK